VRECAPARGSGINPSRRPPTSISYTLRCAVASLRGTFLAAPPDSGETTRGTMAGFSVRGFGVPGQWKRCHAAPPAACSRRRRSRANACSWPYELSSIGVFVFSGRQYPNIRPPKTHVYRVAVQVAWTRAARGVHSMRDEGCWHEIGIV